MEKPVVIITGASRGLGAAVARIAAAQGARVVLAARNWKELEFQAEEIRKNGGEALVVSGDVSKVEDCERIVQVTENRFGRLDALVNNSGVIEPIASIADGDPQEWAQNLAVNLLGPFAMCKFSIPMLRVSKGRVVNVSSGAAVKVFQGWGAYCSAKAALNHFTSVLAAEEPEITAVSMRPGIVQTGMQSTIREKGRSGMPADLHEEFVNYYEQGRLQPPEKPGWSVVALALAVPREWSGEFLRWDDEKVQELVQRYSTILKP